MLTSQLATTFNNLFSEEFLGVKQQKQLSLNEEFMCSEYEALQVESVFEKVKVGFLPQQEVEDSVEFDKPADSDAKELEDWELQEEEEEEKKTTKHKNDLHNV